MHQASVQPLDHTCTTEYGHTQRHTHIPTHTHRGPDSTSVLPARPFWPQLTALLSEAAMTDKVTRIFLSQQMGMSQHGGAFQGSYLFMEVASEQRSQERIEMCVFQCSDLSCNHWRVRQPSLQPTVT